MFQLSLDPIVLSNVSVNPRSHTMGQGGRDDGPSRHADSDIGREVRELVMRMQVDIARLRESVDLKYQFNKHVVSASDRNYHGYTALTAAIAAAKDDGGSIDAPAAYFLAPLPSAPLTTLRVNDSGANTSAVCMARSASATAQGPRSNSIVASAAMQEVHHDRTWNMSTLVEKKLRQQDGTPTRRVDPTSNMTSPQDVGTDAQLRKQKHLRFESFGGGVARDASALSPADASRKQVLSGVPREQTDRAMPAPSTFGKSMTGLWSQPASHNTSGTDHIIKWAASSSTGKPEVDIPPAFDGLGTVSGKALGMTGGRSDSEAYARLHLERMNIERLPLPHEGISALDDPIRNGVLLCRLVNYITSHAQPKKQFRELPVRVGSIEHAKGNFIAALTRIRELHIPSSAQPIPQVMMYLNPSDIIQCGDTSELWGLLAALVEIFIAKSHLAVSAGGGEGAQLDTRVGNVPIVGRFCETYSARNMARLDEAVSNFLFSLNILVEPTEHGIPLDDAGAHVPDPLHAAFLPERRKWHIRTTPFATITLPSVLPYLTNGTALCDVVSRVLCIDLMPFRNPRIRANCISNIRMVQNELMKHSPQRISSAFLCDAAPVFDCDLAFILFLLEDIMRLAAKQPPRKQIPAETLQPFLGVRGGSGGSDDATSPQPRRAPPPTAHRSDESKNQVSQKEALNAQLSRFHQRERQLFAGDTGLPNGSHVTVADPHVVDTVGNRGFRREESVGSQMQAPFTSSSAHPAPTQLRSRTTGVTTAAPSSGRSIVPSDEVRDELRDPASEPLALLPRHLEYLNAVNPDEKELSQLARWLQAKLGTNYHYTAADRMFEVDSNNLQLSQPCFLFADGIVLTHLVRILSYHKCPQLETVQAGPKTNAVKRQNVRKVVEYLRQEKKVLMDYVFLEDVLVSGDLRAVVLVIRGLRVAYKNHKSPSQHK